MDDRSRRTTLAASFGFALIQLDVTIVNVALPTIAQALDASVSRLQWVVDAYALTFAALLLGAGHLGDRLGARRVYLAGLGVFAAASLGCGVSTSDAMLIGMRVLQGVGAAAMLPCSLALITHATADDPRTRARAVGWWTAAGSITIAAGPVLGGLLIGISSWRSIFLINLPVCLVGALLTIRVEETARPPAGQSFDLPGQVLATLALTGLVGAVIEARPLGASHPLVVALAAISVAAAALFLAWERRATAPMLPLDVFRSPTVAVAILYGMAVNLTYYGAVFILSLDLQRRLGFTPVSAGLAFLPLTATFFVVNLVSGCWVGRAGPRAPMVAGALIDAAGFALLGLVAGGTAYLPLLPAFALIPAGMGLGVPAMTVAMLSSVARERSGLASAILNAARQAAGAVGVALFGAFGGANAADGVRVAAILSLAALIAAAALVSVAVRTSRPATPRRSEAEA